MKKIALGERPTIASGLRTLTIAVALSVAAGAAHAVTFTTLVQFNGVNGAHPGNDALTLGPGGFLYGTTGGGGANDGGTVFKISAAGVLTTLASQSRFVTGANSTGGVTFDAAGNIYGTGGGYGQNGNQGTIFKVTPGGTISLLANFPSFVGLTEGLTTAANGDMYGTTPYGGAGQNGTIFKVTTAGVITTLATFNKTNGAYPMGQLTVDNDGNIFGTTENGGINDGSNGYGTVFKLSNTGVFSTLVKFTGLKGAYARGKLVLDGDGNLYGTTEQGSGGTIFKITKAGTFTTLTTFISNAVGKTPTGGLLIDAAGNLFGTTLSGGPNNYGTVFELAKNGVLTTLANFTGTNGINPYAGLTADAGGNLYGTTTNGGFGSYGTIFKVGDTGFVPFAAGVPEPASWALMIMGFGTAGAMLRRRRAAAVAA